MSESNGENRGGNLNEELGKVFKMGVGAVAGAVEKGVNFARELATEGTGANKRAAELGDQLARKGGEALAKTKVFGEQLKDKLSGAAPQDLDGWLGALELLSDEQLRVVAAKIGELLSSRSQDGGQA